MSLWPIMQLYTYSATAVLLLLQLQPSLGQQLCPATRSLSAQRFGFQQAASQGVNDSFAYVVFPIDATGACGGAENASSWLAGMQRAEAAIWSLQTFRSRYPTLLSGVTLGGLLLDTCRSAVRSQQQLGNLLTCETTFGSGAAVLEPRATVGFVGLDSESVAAAALPLLQAAGKATVSYQLSEPQFASRSAQPLLARLSPEPLVEAEALAQALRATGARHATLVHGAGQRQSAMAEALAVRLPQLGICVAASVAASDAAAAAARVNAAPSVRPVFLLLDAVELSSFAEQMLRLRPGSGTFTWLMASDLYEAVAGLLAGREQFFAGALLLQQSATANGFANFQSAFRSLRPDTAGRSQLNPWFTEFWSQRFGCNATSAGSCNFGDSSQNLQTVTEFPASVARVIQATDLLLHSLELVRRSTCGSASVGLCAAFRSDAARFQSVYDSLYSVKSGLGFSDVELNPATGGPATYTLIVQNLQLSSSSGPAAWRPVASYISGALALTGTPVSYAAAGANATWTSTCSDSVCRAACPAAVTTTASTAATAAPTTAATNSSVSSQVRFRQQYWVYALIVCASVGVLATLLFMVYILVIVLDLPPQLKRFNTLWSGQLLLLLILTGYVTLFAWVPWPTADFCGIIRFMVGFLYASIFSILMVKLLNLMNDSLTPAYQVLLFFFGLAVQVATEIEWLLIVPSAVVVDATGSSRCNHSFNDHLITLVYCMLLIAVCIMLAVRAHRIGKNNREVIFIGCCAGLSVPLWLAWTLVGSLNSLDDFKDASMAFGLFANLTLVLLVIFIPKVHQLRQIELDEQEEPAYSDFGDDLVKEPVYMLTVDTNSVYSNRPMSPVFAALQPPLSANSASQLRTRSLAGDLSEGLQVWPRGGARKANSVFNFPGQSAAAAQPPAAAADTRADRLSKLGFL